MTDTCLKDRQILVIEDEYLLAVELCMELTAAEAVVIGPIAGLAKALDVIAGTKDIHAALLDVNLGGEMVFPAAEQLQARNIPMIFVTGYDSAMIPARFRNSPCCEKPLAVRQVIETLGKTLQKT